MLPPTPEALAARRAEIAESGLLSALATRLRALAQPLLDRALYVPAAKATLTRDGGVCPSDGARLAFDPLRPHEHRCTRCGGVVTGERHDGAWLWRYHVWLSERAIHLALLGAILGEKALSARAVELLEAYARVYPTVPNRDNVLGPSRLFFSTYLESIWLAQVSIAATMLERWGSGVLTDDVRAMVRESAALVAQFDEGPSNRQVWNDVGMLAAAGWLGDASLVDRAVRGASGLRRLLAAGVTADGLWYEGENYHFFALRGFMLAGELLRGTSDDLYADPDLGAKLGAMFRAPLDTVLPDLTLPARGDAPFGVSLLQPRFAELWEVARARAPHPRVDAILATLYAAAAPADEDHGFEELAEQEQNRPPAVVRRDGLGWQALAVMKAEGPDAAGVEWRDGPRLLPDAGLAVLTNGGGYLSIECGGNPGGHGHPDLLHVSLVPGANGRPEAPHAVLADFGTGSYVNPSLAWYRSSLAHNAPQLADGGQIWRRAYPAAFDVEGDWSWCQAVARDLLGEGSQVTRSVMLGPHYVLDVVDVDVPDDRLVELPLHPLCGVPRLAREPGTDLVLEGDVSRVSLDPSAGLDAVLSPRDGETVRVQWAPGPPGYDFADGALLSFLVRSAPGGGRWIAAYELDAGTVERVGERADGIVVHTTRGEDHVELSRERAVIRTADGGGRVLEGLRPVPPQLGSLRPAPPSGRRVIMTCPRLARPPEPAKWQHEISAAAVRRLGQAHYRRSEASWEEAGRTVADVATFATRSEIGFAVAVHKSPLVFRGADAPDPALDNEAPDIHSDGLECFVRSSGWEGYLAIPDPSSDQVRVRAVVGTAGDAARARGHWAATRDGWAAVVMVDLGRLLQREERIRVNVVVNEMRPERARRSGQLALAGGGGWVYLRGDRESPDVAAEVIVE